jgi:hypothetical protein
MPTLVRFLTTLLFLGVIFGAAVYLLATFVEPREREMAVRIPADRLEPRPLIRANRPTLEPAGAPTASTTAQ